MNPAPLEADKELEEAWKNIEFAVWGYDDFIGEMTAWRDKAVVAARIEGAKYGRSDELIRLSDWGKTIDDQWNAHFKDRLSQLGAKDE